MATKLSLGDVGINIKIDTKKFRASLKQLSSAAKKASLAIIASFAAFTAFSIKAAMKQEDAVNNLIAALSNSGDASKATIADFKKFASEIQKVTKFGDEEVLALIALQKNLGVSTDRLKEATIATIGLSAATGRGTEAIGTGIAAALQGNFTLLNRYVIELRSTTDATEKMDILTRKATEGFKIAKAQADTTSGAIKQMTNAIGDMAEQFGEPFLEPIKEASKSLQNFVDDNKEKIKLFGKLVVNQIKDAIKWVGDFVKEIGGLEGVLNLLKKAVIAVAVVLTINFIATIAQSIATIFSLIAAITSSTFAFTKNTIAVAANTAALSVNAAVSVKAWSASSFLGIYIGRTSLGFKLIAKDVALASKSLIGFTAKVIAASLSITVATVKVLALGAAMKGLTIATGALIGWKIGKWAMKEWAWVRSVSTGLALLILQITKLINLIPGVNIGGIGTFGSDIRTDINAVRSSQIGSIMSRKAAPALASSAGASKGITEGEKAIISAINNQPIRQNKLTNNYAG